MVCKKCRKLMTHGLYFGPHEGRPERGGTVGRTSATALHSAHADEGQKPDVSPAAAASQRPDLASRVRSIARHADAALFKTPDHAPRQNNASVQPPVERMITLANGIAEEQSQGKPGNARGELQACRYQSMSRISASMCKLQPALHMLSGPQPTSLPPLFRRTNVADRNHNESRCSKQATNVDGKRRTRPTVATVHVVSGVFWSLIVVL